MATAAASSSGVAAPAEKPGAPSVTLAVRKTDRNIIDDRSPGMAGIKYGLEGGEVVQDLSGTFHLFTSEQFGDAYWVVNRIAHWTSRDGFAWHRDPSWAKEGNHDQTGLREKSNYFDPTVAYDEAAGFWYLFYVSYRFSKEKTQFVGKIYRAKALHPGPGGLGGPYHDNDPDDVVVLGPVDRPSRYEAKWVGNSKEGYGAASGTIYRAGNIWYLLWAENLLATAATPSGNFTRLPEGRDNPVTFGRPRMDWITNYINTPIQKYFYYENPIVIRIPERRIGAGTYLMAAGNYSDVTLRVTRSTCGYATSPDGLHWSEMRPLNPGFGNCMTVLSLLPQSDGGYTMFITSRHSKLEKETSEHQPWGEGWVEASFESVSRVSLEVAAR